MADTYGVLSEEATPQRREEEEDKRVEAESKHGGGIKGEDLHRILEAVKASRRIRKAKKYAPWVISGLLAAFITGLLAAFAVWGVVKIGQREIEAWREVYRRWVEIGCPLPIAIAITEGFIDPNDGTKKVLPNARSKIYDVYWS